MNESRRTVMRQGLAVAAITSLGMPVQTLAAWPEKAFKAKSMDAALKALLGSVEATPGDIIIKTPSIAENGAVVPVSVTSNIANTESIAILAVNNPQPLVASFDLAESDAYVSTRIKMAKTSRLVALVKTDARLYSNTVEVKVTIGGCGG